MRKQISGSMPVEVGAAMADNIGRLGDENRAFLQLISSMQRSLCELLIYVNRTSDYAKRAQTVTQEAGRVLQAHGREAVEIPGGGAGKEQ